MTRGLARDAVKEKMGEYPMTSDGLIEFPTLRRLREAREEGEQRGIQQGGLNMLFGLVRKGRLTSGEASEEAGIPLPLFNAKMAEYDARPRA